MKHQQAPQWLVILAFLAIYIVWGTTYLAIIYGLKGFPPFLLSALRYLAAGAILLGWRLYRGEPIPSGPVLKVCAFSGILMLCGGSGLVAWAEQYVSSGQAAIIIASEPFWFLLLDRQRWGEYFSSRFIIIGLVIGFTGIVLFCGFTNTGEGPAAGGAMQLAGYAVLLLSAVLWVTGSLYARNRLGNSASNTMTSAFQLLFAGMCSLLLSGGTGEWARFSFAAVPGQAWAGLLYLVTMGSLVAYLAFTWLITVRPPALVSTHTYVNPVVAVLMGWAFANEQFTGLQLLSLLVILVGVLFTNFPNYRPAFGR